MGNHYQSSIDYEEKTKNATDFNFGKQRMKDFDRITEIPYAERTAWERAFIHRYYKEPRMSLDQLKTIWNEVQDKSLKSENDINKAFYARLNLIEFDSLTSDYNMDCEIERTIEPVKPDKSDGLIESIHVLYSNLRYDQRVKLIADLVFKINEY